MADSKNENRKTKTVSGKQAFKDFTDLVAWQLARELQTLVYELSQQFPADERHVLTAQIRRGVVSVTANLAEGYGRNSYQENSQFCRHSRASTYEVRDHLTAARDGGYISPAKAQTADALARRVIQIVNGYIRSTQNLRRNSADE
jgi:four helix bundle protein